MHKKTINYETVRKYYYYNIAYMGLKHFNVSHEGKSGKKQAVNKF